MARSNDPWSGVAAGEHGGSVDILLGVYRWNQASPISTILAKCQLLQRLGGDSQPAVGVIWLGDLDSNQD
jgi:hypothetical protein